MDLRSGSVDAAGITKRLSWTSLTRVFRHAEPPLRPREICGIIDARASLTRVRRGHRGQVRLTVKPHALEAAVDAVAGA
jgi:hypothetical protein